MEQKQYKLLANKDGNIYGASCSDGWSFVFDPTNIHYQEYLAWISILGNEPLPPDPQPE
jgi:hypothetical protein